MLSRLIWRFDKSRARFGDDIGKSDNEEVSEDYFASEHICRVNVIKEFREDEYEGETLMIGRCYKRSRSQQTIKKGEPRSEARSGKSESSS